MAKLQEVVDALASLQQLATETDAAVEALYDQIVALTGDGITQEAADLLLAKIAEVRGATEVIASDD